MSDLEYRTKQVVVKIFLCPKCGKDMEEETNRDARTMYHYKCPSCGYLH